MLRGAVLLAVACGCGRIGFQDRTGDGSMSGSDGLGSGGSGSDSASSICSGLISVYRFDNATNLGLDSVGTNQMTLVYGSPQQSTQVPPGLTGHSLQLDGSSSVCTGMGLTFDQSKSHTLCWWSNPSVLDVGDQIAQYCAYDTWWGGTGGAADYNWSVNHCSATQPEQILTSPSLFQAGVWDRICESYDQTTQARALWTLRGSTPFNTSAQATTVFQSGTLPWCIGSFRNVVGGVNAGYFHGLIYRMQWFGSVLGQTEIAALDSNPC
jgi:hypothetical protein